MLAELPREVKVGVPVASVDVPRLAGGRVAEGGLAAGGRVAAPAHPGVLPGAEVAGRGGREDRPARVVGVEVDEVLADQHLPGAAVDVAGERGRVLGVRADHGHLVGGPGPVQRGGHGHRPDGVAGHRVGGQLGVGERGGVRLLGGAGGRRRRAGVPGQRGADREHRAVGDREGDEAVRPGGQVAEALPEGDHCAAADRPDQHPFHAGHRGGVHAEQVAVGGQVGAGGGLRVGGQPAGERGATGAERLRGAEPVPPDVGVDGAGQAALAGVGCRRTGAVVGVGGRVPLGERPGPALGGRRAAGGGRGAHAGGEQRGDRRRRRQDGDEPASTPAHRG